MKILKCVLVVLLFSFAIPLAHANDASALPGVGAKSCGKWLEGREMRSDTIDDFLVSWIQGFLSGLNMHRKSLTNEDMISLPDSSTLLAYVDKYCRDNPLETPLLASINLFVRLRDQ